MKTVLMIVFILIAAIAGAATGYLYGVDQGKTEATNVRAEFFAARAAPSNPSADPNAATQPGQQNQARGAGLAALRGTAGIIKSIQGNTLQVTAQDGSTVNVNLDAQTNVQKMVPGTNADLKAGERITVQGNASSGTVNARLIIVGLGQ
ncbi:MAG: hypothetical protein HY868_04165 [Chloroflexi bacterium]|nr:hypothetical protein [Chloroflexota bacterium]